MGVPVSRLGAEKPSKICAIVGVVPVASAASAMRRSTIALSLIQRASSALSRVPAIFGIAIAAMTAMTAMTTRSSTKLNAELIFALRVLVGVFITLARYGRVGKSRNFRDLVFLARVFL